MAAIAVLTCPELLTEILLCLPVRDLLLAQRVSSLFRALIGTVPALQRALFFRAEDLCVTASEHEDTVAGIRARCENEPLLSLPVSKYRVNPLLFVEFWPWYKVTPLVAGLGSGLNQDLAVVLGFYVSKKAVIPDSPQSRNCYIRGGDITYERTSRGDAFLRKEASWRRMLVCQPPPQRLHFVRHTNALGGDQVSHGTTFCSPPASRHNACPLENGLRMGMLYDTTSHGRFTTFGVDWHMFEDQEAMVATISQTDGNAKPSMTMPTGQHNAYLERSRYPRTLQNFKELGLINDDSAYLHEVTIMTRYTRQCVRKSTPPPDMRSEAYEKVNIALKDVTPMPDNGARRGSGWRFGVSADFWAIRLALGQT